uniref:Uncharacterized protein n=1 Tax=Anguilla anguilla TaxID=7936 RepID=A0A0E9WJ63_ANGAN
MFSRTTCASYISPATTKGSRNVTGMFCQCYSIATTWQRCCVNIVGWEGGYVSKKSQHLALNLTKTCTRRKCPNV